MALKSARWLFLAYVVLLPIVRPLNFRYLGIHILLTDVIFAAALAFWILSFRHRRPVLDRRYAAFVGAFLVALVVSAIFSIEPFKSAVKLAGVVYLIAISAITIDLIRDADYLKRLTIAWLIGTLITVLGTIAGVTGYYLGYDTLSTNFFLFHSGSLPVGNYPRVMAFFENPNMTANYLNVSIMLVLAAGRVGWFSLRTSLLAALSIFGAALFTISAGLGGLILSVSLWIAFAFSGVNRYLRGAVLVGGFLIAFLAVLSSSIAPVARESPHTTTIPFIDVRIEPSVRSLVWTNALERGMEYPLLGRGTGTDAAEVRYVALSGQRQILRDAHQAWLNVFGQAGLVGLLAFIALGVYLVSICRFRISSESVQAVFLAACSCAFVGAFLLQNLFGSFEDARHLWVLIGMMVGLNRPSTD
ncbi:MAG TPA: hypothetical protein VFZ49_07575 [Pyrinomonadaceae bacterium]